MLTDTYIFFGGLLIALCAPLVLGLVPPNNWYGIRLPAFATPDKWYPLQRRGGLVLLLLGVALVATGILLHWVAPPLSQRVQILLTVLLIPIFYTTMVAILIGASRMLR
jgi:hypothetical protein